MAGSTEESLRLAALHRYQIMDTPPEAEFDAVVRSAAAAFRTPIALVSLIDRDRQWFKARVGVDISETPRAISFCTHAIQSDDIMVVSDARDDVRFRDNPAVTGEPYVRFYAGTPLISADGYRVGTLCVVDVEPRPPLSQAERATIDWLGRRTVALLETRRARQSQRGRPTA